MTQKRSGSRSRNKGKRGELELSHVLQEYGFDARRGQQYAGINGDADVVGVPGLHIECKRVEALNVEKALQHKVLESEQIRNIYTALGVKPCPLSAAATRS